MKALKYLILLAVIFIAGCEKDDTMLEGNRAHGRNDIELKRANVPIPLKADCWVIPDWDSAPILIEGLDPSNPNSYSLTRMFIGGTGTHFGRINPDESYYLFDRIVPGVDEDNEPCMYLNGVGKIVGANGDGIEFDFRTRQYPDSRFFGVGDIIPGSGTGKFKGSTGSFETFGGRNGDELWFKANGYLFFE